MALGGWIFMLVSISFVLGLAGFCFYRVLNVSSEQEREDA